MEQQEQLASDREQCSVDEQEAQCWFYEGWGEEGEEFRMAKREIEEANLWLKVPQNLPKSKLRCGIYLCLSHPPLLLYYGAEDQYIYLLYSGFLGCFLAVLAFGLPGVLSYCISDPCLTL